MAEKTFNTRILLKYDSHENWITNDPVLKKGEVALTTVSVKQDGVVNEVPSVLIKVGDGTHKYSELDFTYAKAADVVAAAKSESALTTFINNVIASSGLATDSAMTALSGRVTTAEGKITALEGLVGDKKVAVQISEAIAGLDLANTYAAKSHTHAMTEVTGLGDAIADAKQAGTDAAAALDTYKAANDTKVTANTNAIAAIKDGTTIDSFADVETALAGKQAVGDYATKAEAQGYADAKDAAITAAQNAADAAQADVDALEAKVGTVPSDKTVVEMISDAQTAATYDDTQVKADIKTNADAIDVLETLVGDTAVATQISSAVNSAKTELKGSDADTAASATIAGAKKYADSLDAAMDARVDALEAAVGEDGSVAEKITAEIQKLDVEDTAVAGQYVSAVSEADGKISVTRAALPDYTEVYDAKGAAAQALTDAKNYADGLNTAMDTRMDAAESAIATLNGDVTTEGSVKKQVADSIAEIVNDNNNGSIDTLNEIAAWIVSDTTGAAKMNADIAANKASITALEGKVGDKTVSEQIADITNPLDTRIDNLEADTHTHANKALLDTYTQTEANLADAVAKKHEHTNKTVLDGITAEKVTAWDKVSEKANDADLATIAKTGNVNDLIQTAGDVIVFDCGSSSVNI